MVIRGECTPVRLLTLSPLSLPIWPGVHCFVIFQNFPSARDGRNISKTKQPESLVINIHLNCLAVFLQFTADLIKYFKFVLLIFGEPSVFSSAVKKLKN
jgi:hypothetical protein